MTFTKGILTSKIRHFDLPPSLFFDPLAEPTCVRPVGPDHSPEPGHSSSCCRPSTSSRPPSRSGRDRRRGPLRPTPARWCPPGGGGVFVRRGASPHRSPAQDHSPE